MLAHLLGTMDEGDAGVMGGGEFWHLVDNGLESSLFGG